jgi:hypothetical protein
VNCAYAFLLPACRQHNPPNSLAYFEVKPQFRRLFVPVECDDRESTCPAPSSAEASPKLKKLVNSSKKKKVGSIKKESAKGSTKKKGSVKKAARGSSKKKRSVKKAARDSNKKKPTPSVKKASKKK